MATTTNYGWTTPDDTALVKDGAAAIRTLGSSIDTTTKNLNPSTTLGDIEYRSSTANTNTRLGVGSTGQVLTVAAGVPSWSTPAGASANWSLENAGGTTLSGTSVSITGISGKDKIMVLIKNASFSSGTNDYVSIRFNSDSGSNYYGFGILQIGSSNYGIADGSSRTGIPQFALSTNAGSIGASNLLITGCNTAGAKIFQQTGGADFAGGSSPYYFYTGGYYDSSSTISSVQIIGAATFDGGTVYVYTSA